MIETVTHNTQFNNYSFDIKHCVFMLFEASSLNQPFQRASPERVFPLTSAINFDLASANLKK
jgi:hypothetical protein